MNRPIEGQKVLIVGGAGFLGSHFTDELLLRRSVAAVTLFDNFSSGREWHYRRHAGDSRLRVIRGDVKDIGSLKAAMDGHDAVIHLASNPDIARAASEPTIDFDEGTLLTNHVVEAMRCTGAKRILYASGSGVYGDLGAFEAFEDFGPLLPTSTYGASKLAGEALISSYCSMFGLTGCAFRFGNVVGPRQTHGVAFDFLRRLLQNPTELVILGDGTQSKSYIHVYDVVDAVLRANETTGKPFDVFNVATGDYITVSEIAHMVVRLLGLDPGSVRLQFGNTPFGWKGDVPIVRLNTDRIRGRGWACSRSTRKALEEAILAMIPDATEGRFA